MGIKKWWCGYGDGYRLLVNIVPFLLQLCCRLQSASLSIPMWSTWLSNIRKFPTTWKMALMVLSQKHPQPRWPTQRLGYSQTQQRPKQSKETKHDFCFYKNRKKRTESVCRPTPICMISNAHSQSSKPTISEIKEQNDAKMGKQSIRWLYLNNSTRARIAQL